MYLHAEDPVMLQCGLALISLSAREGKSTLLELPVYVQPLDYTANQQEAAQRLRMLMQSAIDTITTQYQATVRGLNS